MIYSIYFVSGTHKIHELYEDSIGAKAAKGQTYAFLFCQTEELQLTLTKNPCTVSFHN